MDGGRCLVGPLTARRGIQVADRFYVRQAAHLSWKLGNALRWSYIKGEIAWWVGRPLAKALGLMTAIGELRAIRYGHDGVARDFGLGRLQVSRLGGGNDQRSRWRLRYGGHRRGKQSSWHTGRIDICYLSIGGDDCLHHDQGHHGARPVQRRHRNDPEPDGSDGGFGSQRREWRFDPIHILVDLNRRRVGHLPFLYLWCGGWGRQRGW